jgi:hypothetical protein
VLRLTSWWWKSWIKKTDTQANRLFRSSIKMPEMDGMEMLKRAQKIYTSSLAVFSQYRGR